MSIDFAALDGALPGRVDRPGSAAYAAACDGFDLSSIPTPDATVSVTDADDVSAAVRVAAAQDLPVAVRATGHGPLHGVDRGVLIDTRALSTVTVDADRRTATVGAGARWTQVLAKCAPLGLIPVCGSSPNVGVAAYSLGGGLSPLGRQYGWAADRVNRLTLVTADGEIRSVTADSEPELFWAVRGGGGSFGVATELEFDLFPGKSLYGGGLFLPGETAPELLAALGRVTADAPDELTLSVAFVSFPDFPAVPPPLRGRFIANVRVAYMGAPEQAESLIAPLRAVAAPLVDSVRPLPIAEFGTIHNDPTLPQKVSCGGAVLPGWDDTAISVLLDNIGASRPFMLELRHLGGALARPPANADSVGNRDAAFNVFTSAYPGPAFAAATEMQTELYSRLEPWTGRRSIYNFAARPDGGPVDARGLFDSATFDRLQATKADVDPQDLFRFNITIPAARS